MLATISDYLHFYRKFLSQNWDNLGPQEYVIILVSVGVIGWFMMRKAGSMT